MNRDNWFRFAVALSLAFFAYDYANRLRDVSLQATTIEQRVVGRTPEGFHRKDAAELMDALCAANPGLVCPKPYKLPNYLRQIEDRAP